MLKLTKVVFRKDDLEWALDLLKQKRLKSETGNDKALVYKEDCEGSSEHLVKIRT